MVRGHQLDVAQAKENRRLNNYADILPDTRRIPFLLSPVRDTTYYNATYYDTHNEGTSIKYICANGPNRTSLSSFWHMIIDYDVRVIAMVTRTVENNRPKCENYFPCNTSPNGNGIRHCIEIILIKVGEDVVEKLSILCQGEIIGYVTKLRVTSFKMINGTF